MVKVDIRKAPDCPSTSTETSKVLLLEERRKYSLAKCKAKRKYEQLENTKLAYMGGNPLNNFENILIVLI